MSVRAFQHFSAGQIFYPALPNSTLSTHKNLFNSSFMALNTQKYVLHRHIGNVLCFNWFLRTMSSMYNSKRMTMAYHTSPIACWVRLFLLFNLVYFSLVFHRFEFKMVMGRSLFLSSNVLIIIIIVIIISHCHHYRLLSFTKAVHQENWKFERKRANTLAACLVNMWKYVYRIRSLHILVGICNAHV